MCRMFDSRKDPEIAEVYSLVTEPGTWTIHSKWRFLRKITKLSMVHSSHGADDTGGVSVHGQVTGSSEEKPPLPLQATWVLYVEGAPVARSGWPELRRRWHEWQESS